MVASREQLNDDVLHIFKMRRKRYLLLDIIALLCGKRLLSVDGDAELDFSHRLIREALCEKKLRIIVYYSNILIFDESAQ